MEAGVLISWGISFLRTKLTYRSYPNPSFSHWIQEMSVQDTFFLQNFFTYFISFKHTTKIQARGPHVKSSLLKYTLIKRAASLPFLLMSTNHFTLSLQPLLPDCKKKCVECCTGKPIIDRPETDIPTSSIRNWRFPRASFCNKSTWCSA